MATGGKIGKGKWRKRLSAHVYAKRWRTASSNVQVIVVAGPYGKSTVARFLHHVCTRQGDVVSMHDKELTSARDVQDALRDARKSKATVAILCMDDELLKTGALASTIPELLVVPFCDTAEMAGKRYDWVRPHKYAYGLELGETPLENGDDTKVAFGENSRVDAVIKQVTLYKKGTEFTLLIDHQIKLELATYLVGRVNADNIAAVVSSIYVLHRSLDDIDDLVADIEKVEGNYEYISAPTPFTVVADSAPDQIAALAVISSAKELVKRRLIGVVEASRVGEANIETISEQVDRLVVIDVNDFKRDKLGIERVVSPDGAYRKVVQIARQGDTVLLLGDAFLKRDEHGMLLASSALSHSLESH